MNPADETLTYRVGELEKANEKLAQKVDRLHWSLVSLTITLATTSVLLVITKFVG